VWRPLLTTTETHDDVVAIRHYVATLPLGWTDNRELEIVGRYQNDADMDSHLFYMCYITEHIQHITEALLNTNEQVNTCRDALLNVAAQLATFVNYILCDLVFYKICKNKSLFFKY